MKLKNILLGCILIFGLSEVVYSQGNPTVYKYGEGSAFDPLRGRNKFDPIPVYIFSEMGGVPKRENGKYYIKWTENPDTNFVSYRFLESMSEDMSNPTIDSTITERSNETFPCNPAGCKGYWKFEVKDDHLTKFWGNPSKYYQVIVKNSLGLTFESEIIKW